MSTYPGDDESTTDQPATDQPATDQPATDQPATDQPATDQPGEAASGAADEGPGYWERHAAEQGQQQPPYGQIPGVNPYGPYAPPGQQQYGSPPPAGPQPYYPPPGGPQVPPYVGYAAPLPNHPQATTALVLGLVGLIGGLVLCGVGLLASPFAWALGRNSLKEIRASSGRLGGESSARAGMIMGIIGTVLLFLALLAVIAFVALLAFAGTSSTGSSI